MSSLDDALSRLHGMCSEIHDFVDLADAKTELDTLRKELEDAKKDAARYQWLRSRKPGGDYRIAGIIYSESSQSFDTAIDAAMENVK